MALVAYPINDDLTVGDKEVLYDFSPHRGIDGMCLDEDGNIVAAAGSGDSGPGSMLYVFAPDGRVIDTHPIPDSLPTNCAFAEADLSTIYATGGDGGLYRAETDRAGYLDAR
jgi:gluconolactonase